MVAFWVTILAAVLALLAIFRVRGIQGRSSLAFEWVSPVVAFLLTALVILFVALASDHPAREIAAPLWISIAVAVCLQSIYALAFRVNNVPAPWVAVIAIIAITAGAATYATRVVGVEASEPSNQNLSAKQDMATKSIDGTVKSFLEAISKSDSDSARKLACGSLEESLSSSDAQGKLESQVAKYGSDLEFFPISMNENGDRAQARGNLIRRLPRSDRGWSLAVEFELQKYDKNWKVCSYKDELNK